MRKRTLVILAAALAAASCQSLTPQERRTRDEAECRSYGFAKRNDAFAECLQRLELDRRAARRAALHDNSWPLYRSGFGGTVIRR